MAVFASFCHEEKDSGCSLICHAVPRGQKQHVCVQEMAWNCTRNSASPHPSLLGRSASVSKPCRQAIHQAEGSPEPLNKTFSQPSAEIMETNTADVKGVAGITNDVLMAAQAISVPPAL